MSYEFQSIWYRMQSDMHAAIAERWLSADGINSREDMLRFLSDMSDEDCAINAETNWELADHEYYDRSELMAAFAELRANFDERFPADEEN
jgi:hypothetical protein